MAPANLISRSILGRICKPIISECSAEWRYQNRIARNIKHDIARGQKRKMFKNQKHWGNRAAEKPILSKKFNSNSSNSSSSNNDKVVNETAGSIAVSAAGSVVSIANAGGVSAVLGKKNNVQQVNTTARPKKIPPESSVAGPHAKAKSAVFLLRQPNAEDLPAVKRRQRIDFLKAEKLKSREILYTIIRAVFPIRPIREKQIVVPDSKALAEQEEIRRKNYNHQIAMEKIVKELRQKEKAKAVAEKELSSHQIALNKSVKELRQREKAKAMEKKGLLHRPADKHDGRGSGNVRWVAHSKKGGPSSINEAVREKPRAVEPSATAAIIRVVGLKNTPLTERNKSVDAEKKSIETAVGGSEVVGAKEIRIVVPDSKALAEQEEIRRKNYNHQIAMDKIVKELRQKQKVQAMAKKGVETAVGGREVAETKESRIVVLDSKALAEQEEIRRKNYNHQIAMDKIVKELRQKQKVQAMAKKSIETAVGGREVAETKESRIGVLDSKALAEQEEIRRKNYNHQIAMEKSAKVLRQKRKVQAIAEKELSGHQVALNKSVVELRKEKTAQTRKEKGALQRPTERRDAKSSGYVQPATTTTIPLEGVAPSGPDKVVEDK